MVMLLCGGEKSVVCTAAGQHQQGKKRQRVHEILPRTTCSFIPVCPAIFFENGHSLETTSRTTIKEETSEGNLRVSVPIQHFHGFVLHLRPVHGDDVIIH